MSYFRLFLKLFALVFGLLCLTQCQTISKWTGKKAGSSTHAARYAKFRKKADYPKTAFIYRNMDVLNKEGQHTKRMVIDLSDQRILFYVGNEVAIDSPCCTGKAGKRTLLWGYSQ